AEIPPSNPTPTPVPTGAVLPPKKETGKVQPKKETVRINLPPKPTAAPTIKLPTLPPGGPTGAPSPVSAGAPTPAAPAPALRTAAAPAAPAAAAPVKGAAPTAAPKSTPVAQRAAAPVVPSIKTIDKILIFSAAVASLAAVGGVTWVFLTLKNVVENFSS
ncbi:MAG: hypothetical protein WCK57_08805, partial [Verrucomicrobiae bacterium]